MPGKCRKTKLLFSKNKDLIFIITCYLVKREKITSCLFSPQNGEKRLWICLLIVLVALYSTICLASTLAGLLRDRNLLTPVLFFCLFLVGATVVTQGLKTRPAGVEIAVLLGMIASFLLMFSRMAIPDAHRGHLIEYSVVAVFLFEALRERSLQGRRVPNPALLAIIGTTLLGLLDECIQSLLPSRVFDPADMLFNFLAGVMAVTASLVLSWVRRRFF